MLLMRSVHHKNDDGKHMQIAQSCTEGKSKTITDNAHMHEAGKKVNKTGTFRFRRVLSKGAVK